jgi:hypothetical protein
VEEVDLNNWFQDREKWQDILNTVINFGVS